MLRSAIYTNWYTHTHSYSWLLYRPDSVLGSISSRVLKHQRETRFVASSNTNDIAYGQQNRYNYTNTHTLTHLYTTIDDRWTSSTNRPEKPYWRQTIRSEKKKICRLREYKINVDGFREDKWEAALKNGTQFLKNILLRTSRYTFTLSS